MYSKLDQISVLRMSKSELFLQKEEIEIDILIRSTLEFEDHHRHHEEEEASAEENNNNKCESSSSTVSSEELLQKNPSTSEESKVNENDDGFKTPTSLENKIPAIKHCPPAPRKLKKPLSSRKRKLSSTAHRRNLNLLDVSKDVESMFPSPLLADIGRKIKKARN